MLRRLPDTLTLLPLMMRSVPSFSASPVSALLPLVSDASAMRAAAPFRVSCTPLAMVPIWPPA